VHVLAVEVEPTRFAGGQERSLFEVCRELSNAGVEISLAYQNQGDLLPDYRTFLTSEIHQKNRVFRVPKSVSFFVELLRMLRFVKEKSIDILYVNQYFDLPFYALLSKISGLPLVCHLRLPCPDYVSKQYRFGLNQCAGCLAISNHTKQTYVDAGFPGAKIDVLYNAIDTSELISPMADSESNPEIIKLIYVGRISREKGLDVLFKAFQLLRKSGKQAKLTILGKERGSDVPENYREQLLNYVNDEFRGEVDFKGHAEHVDSEIMSHDIIVVPSVWPEPFGRVVLEGLRLGKPVICSRIGGMQEIFGGEEFFMFHPGGEKALKEKIEQVIQNPQKTTLKMEQLQQRMKAKFSYTNYADQWIEKVRNLI